MTDRVMVSPAPPHGEATERPHVQIVPVRALPIVALVLAFVVASIVANWRWGLMFCHVVGGGLWTGIDLFVGLVIGPILGRLSIPARAEFSARFMPRMAPFRKMFSRPLSSG